VFKIKLYKNYPDMIFYWYKINLNNCYKKTKDKIEIKRGRGMEKNERLNWKKKQKERENMVHINSKAP
jgi:hypothetical protein